MDRTQLLSEAIEMTDAYLSILLIDPFTKVSVDISNGDFISKCIKEDKPLSWIISLNPDRHNTIYDIHYSIIEALLKILFNDLSEADNPVSRLEFTNRVIAKLSTSFCNIFCEDEESEEENSNYEEG